MWQPWKGNHCKQSGFQHLILPISQIPCFSFVMSDQWKGAFMAQIHRGQCFTFYPHTHILFTLIPTSFHVLHSTRSLSHLDHISGTSFERHISIASKGTVGSLWTCVSAYAEQSITCHPELTFSCTFNGSSSHKEDHHPARAAAHKF